jgi:hypothetical protein
MKFGSHASGVKMWEWLCSHGVAATGSYSSVELAGVGMVN